ncbi:MAG: hypothetical protein ACPLZD_10880 [Candidatus Saccharicenans sp.]
MKDNQKAIYCLAFMLFLCLIISEACTPEPKLSPMQIRQITTKLFDSDYETVFRACLTVFQDQGYIIKNTDMDSGLIVASIDKETSAGSQGFQRLLLGYVS